MAAREGAKSVAGNGEEAREAILTLTDADKLRLRKKADFRIRGLGQHRHGRDWGDLLQEAILRVLDGSRQWSSEIGIVRYLDQVMRSICSSWKKSGERREGAETGFISPTDEENAGADAAVDPTPNAEKLALDRQQLDRIGQLFEDEPDALEVLAGLQLGMKGPEVQDATGLSKNEFEAARRRIRRRLMKEGLRDGQ